MRVAAWTHARVGDAMVRPTRILVTTTSFQDTPGAHHDVLAASGFDIVRARGSGVTWRLRISVSYGMSRAPFDSGAIDEVAAPADVPDWRRFA